VLNKLLSWIKSLGKQDPNEVMPVTWDVNGKKQEMKMTAREIDDFTEAFFGDRWMKTEKKPSDKKPTTQ